MDKFRNGKTNLHTLHIQSKSNGKEHGCSNCHDPHSSTQEMQIRTSFIHNKFSLPLTYLKQANGGSCTTACHGKKDYDRVTPIINKEGR
jgi:hypothetical protein